MNDGLQDLYREVILDHNRSPRNWGEIPGAHHIEGRNPLCGDHISLSVQVDGDVDRWVSASLQQPAGVIGDAAGDFFGIDMGL